MEKTALEKLIDEFQELGEKIITGTDASEIAKKYLELQEKQICDAWESAYSGDCYHESKDYFDDTFNLE